MQADAAAVLDAAHIAAATANAIDAGLYEVELCAAAPPPGRQLRVVGSCPALGGWELDAAPVMRPIVGGLGGRRGEDDVGSSVTVRLPAADTVEMKLVEVDKDGSNPVWQVRSGAGSRACRAPSVHGPFVGRAMHVAIARLPCTERRPCPRIRVCRVHVQGAAHVSTSAPARRATAACHAGRH